MKLFKSNIKIKSSTLWIIGTIVVIVVAGIGLYIWNKSNAGQLSINIQADQNPATVGLPLNLTVDLNNNADNDLENVQMQISLPSGLPLANGSNESVVDQNIGDIAKGSLSEQKVQVIPIPESSNVQQVTVTVSYSVGSLSATFQTVSTYNVNVQNLPVTFALTSPTTTFSGEQMETTAAYGWDPSLASNVTSSANFPPLSVQFTYPSTFALTSSVPAASSTGQTTWSIGQLSSNQVGQLVVRGKVNLPDNTQFSTGASIDANILGQEYILSSTSTQTMISASPLSLNIIVNDSTSTIAQPGQTLNYTLNYANNTQVPFQAVVIQANLSGDMLDWNSLNSPGATFDPNRDTLTWDSSQNPGLASLSPGASSSVGFSISLDNTYPIAQLNDKDFSSNVAATITSPTVPYLISADQTINTASLQTKVAGLAQVQANGFFRDATSGLVNSGPFPPVVGTPTEYTIHWDLTNYSDDLSNVVVEAQLPPGVTFTGQSSSNIQYSTSVPEFSSSNNSMIWDVGTLPATSGILTTVPEGIFQIQATPSSGDVGQYMTLLSPTLLTATDSFTGLSINTGSSAVTTLLPSDDTVSPNQGLVVSQ